MQQSHKQIVIDGLLTTYTQVGKGRKVLLLHGWGDSTTGLQILTDALSNNFEVVSVNLPGFGGTQAPSQAWGLNDYSHFVGLFIDKLSLNLHAIVGHSNGGAIALRGVSRNDFSADNLVLLSSSGVRGAYKGRVKAIRLVTKAGKAITKPLPSNIKNKLRRKVYDSVGSDMLVAEHLQETFKKVVTDDVCEDAAQISLPTLLIYGSKDTATPPSFGQHLQDRIAGSKLEIIEGAGHFVHLDAPKAVISKIKEFLA